MIYSWADLKIPYLNIPTSPLNSPENLDLETLNKVRNALGLNDLSEAIKKGNEITKKVNSNLE